MLRVRTAPEIDAEKNIAIAAPENLSLLGLDHGGHVKMFVVIKDSQGEIKNRTLSRIAVRRESYDTRGGPVEDLLMREVLRLDLDGGRLALGIEGAPRDYPIVVQADFLLVRQPSIRIVVSDSSRHQFHSVEVG